jgi:ligand-binding sensor domain-containing protein
MHKKLLISLIFSITLYLPYTYGADSLWVQYTKCGSINSIIQNDQNLWVGTDVGLVEVDTDGVPERFFNCANSGIKYSNIRLVWKDNSRNIWVASDEGIAKYNGVNWTNFDSLSIGFNAGSFQQAAVDKTGKVWLVGNGVKTFDGNTWSNLDTSNSCITGRTYSVAVDTGDVKWIGTSDGLVRISGSDCTKLDTTNSNIPGNTVYKITIDTQDNI